AEALDLAVGREGLVPENLELQREVVLEVVAREAVAHQERLVRVTAETHPDRVVLAEELEGRHADVAPGPRGGGPHDLDVAPSGPVARLAIDREAPPPRLLLAGRGIAAEVDLAAVAVEAAARMAVVPEDAVGRPVVRGGERQIGSDRRPRQVVA